MRRSLRREDWFSCLVQGLHGLSVLRLESGLWLRILIIQVKGPGPDQLLGLAEGHLSIRPWLVMFLEAA